MNAEALKTIYYNLENTLTPVEASSIHERLKRTDNSTKKFEREQTESMDEGEELKDGQKSSFVSLTGLEAGFRTQTPFEKKKNSFNDQDQQDRRHRGSASDTECERVHGGACGFSTLFYTHCIVLLVS